MAAARHQVLISRAHGARQKPVTHRPAVDEEMLHRGATPAERGQAHQPGETNLVAHRLDVERIGDELASHDLANARAPRREQIARARRQLQHGSVVVEEAEGDVGPRHGEPLHRGRGMAELGARRLLKLEPRRRRIKQITHLDTGARRVGNRPRRRHAARIESDRPGAVDSGGTADQREAADRADRGQRFAAEPEALDRLQVVTGQLRCGVTLDREGKLVGAHATAIVGDGDEVAPAARDHDIDTARARIDGVFDEFLHDAGGPFDHFAGRDAVDQGCGQNADPHGAIPPSARDTGGPTPCPPRRPADRTDRPRATAPRAPSPA